MTPDVAVGGDEDRIPKWRNGLVELVNALKRRYGHAVSSGFAARRIEGRVVAAAAVAMGAGGVGWKRLLSRRATELARDRMQLFSKAPDV